MDRRSWPWKKKSSEKAAAEKAVPAADSTGVPLVSAGGHDNQGKVDKYKNPNYVQISVESYTHLTGLEEQVKSYEDQVKTLEDEVKELNDKLSAAHSEMTTKENLVKQHAKVAEEAVSGWESAEAEAAALKNHLEAVTLLKLTAEDKASHLDSALKECMLQTRNLKEEHEQKLHEVGLAKQKQLEKIILEFEAKITNLDQELLRSAAENDTLSRSLQERSNMLIKMTEEKSQAEAEIELLKCNIDSCEREINSLKYELHMAAKELEIRNEEKNMSVRSAEVANKQHLEGAKKIAKLEAECQRLRSLVKKKLPGPAALAQMKLEVENLGRDYGETRLRRTSVKPNPHLSLLPDFSLDSVEKYHKENELITGRLLAMEEETKMLKEALAKRNNELQASRNICAKTVSRLQTLEAHVHTPSEQKRTPKSTALVPTEGSFSHASNPPSLTSLSEDGNDDEVSCAGSWSTALISELSHFKKEKNSESPNKVEHANHLVLMDDFLEMEKLACLSNDSNGTNSSPDIPNYMRSETSEPLDEQMNSKVEVSAPNPQLDADPTSMDIQARISMVLESLPKDADMEKVLEGTRSVVQDIQNNLHQKPVEVTHCPEVSGDSEASREDSEITTEKEIYLSTDVKLGTETGHAINEDLAAAISQILESISFLCKEANAVHSTFPDEDGLSQKLDDFSGTINKVLNTRISLDDFVIELSSVFAKASELRFNVLGYRNTEGESNSSDYIDKVALPENKGVQDSTSGRYVNGCAHFSDSISDPDMSHEANFVPTSESAATTWKCSLEEFEQLKLEKDNLVKDLAKCMENLESTKSQLQETEQLLAEVKSQLASAQKLNSLAETQLKCMAESYKSLEARAEESKTEVNLLRAKTENLNNELREETRSHQNALARCKDLEEQLERFESCPRVDDDAKTKRERELADAAEKLAECQETIFLLGKQLKALCPQTEFMGSPYSEKSRIGESLNEEEPITTGMNFIGSLDMDTATSPNRQRPSGEYPVDMYSDSEANTLLRSPVSSTHTNHQPTKSGSSSSPTPPPEKHSRGFGRFFSSKGKNGQ